MLETPGPLIRRTGGSDHLEGQESDPDFDLPTSAGDPRPGSQATPGHQATIEWLRGEHDGNQAVKGWLGRSRMWRI